MGREHKTAAHRAARAAMKPAVDAGLAFCSQPVCLMRHRWIAPGSAWHAAHNRRTGGYYGPAHARCNTSDGATFRNRQRGYISRRPRPPSSSTSWSSRDW